MGIVDLYMMELLILGFAQNDISAVDPLEDSESISPQVLKMNGYPYFQTTSM
jgi:hypothetical protein